MYIVEEKSLLNSRLYAFVKPHKNMQCGITVHIHSSEPIQLEIENNICKTFFSRLIKIVSIYDVNVISIAFRIFFINLNPDFECENHNYNLAKKKKKN